MRLASLLLAASLLLTATLAVAPAASAAAQPVGDCEDPGSVATLCYIVCIQPPCHSYVCIEKPQRVCHPL